MNSPPTSAAPAQSVGALLAYLWSRRWLLVASTLAATGLGAIYLALATPVYTVRARLLVQRKAVAIVDDRNARDDGFLATQAEIIRSPAVLDPALKASGVDTQPDSPANPLVRAMESFNVLTVRGTNVLSIGYRDNSADNAVRFVQSVIEQYKSYVQGSEQNANLDALGLLTNSEKELRQELESLEAKYQETRRQSPLIGQDRDATNLPKLVLDQLSRQLADTRGERIAMQARSLLIANLAGQPATATHLLAAVAKSGNTIQPTAREIAAPIQNSTVQHVLLEAADQRQGNGFDALLAELWQARTRGKQLAHVYGQKHPEVRTAIEQAASWENLLEERVRDTALALTQQVEALQHTEKILEEQYQAEVAKAKEIDGALIREQQLMDRIKRVQTIHESTLAKLNDLQLTSQALSMGNAGVRVDVLEPPRPPEGPLWPQPTIVLATTALLGFLVAALGLLLFQPGHTLRLAS